MRSLSELYIVLLQYYKDTNRLYICNAIRFAYQDDILTSDEYDLLSAHFLSQRPTSTLHSEFFNDDITIIIGDAWFYDYGINIRMKFLTMLIEHTK